MDTKTLTLSCAGGFSVGVFLVILGARWRKSRRGRNRVPTIAESPRTANLHEFPPERPWRAGHLRMLRMCEAGIRGLSSNNRDEVQMELSIMPLVQGTREEASASLVDPSSLRHHAASSSSRTEKAMPPAVHTPESSPWTYPRRTESPLRDDNPSPTYATFRQERSLDIILETPPTPLHEVTAIARASSRRDRPVSTGCTDDRGLSRPPPYTKELDPYHPLPLYASADPQSTVNPRDLDLRHHMQSGGVARAAPQGITGLDAVSGLEREVIAGLESDYRPHDIGDIPGWVGIRNDEYCRQRAVMEIIIEEEPANPLWEDIVFAMVAGHELRPET